MHDSLPLNVVNDNFITLMVALHTTYLIFQTLNMLKEYFISLYMYMHIPNDSYLQLKRSEASTFLAGNNWVVWSVSDKLSPQYDQRTVRHLNMGPMNQIAHQSSRNQILLSTDYSFNKLCLSKFLFSVLSITEDFKTYKLTYYLYYLEYWNLIQNHNLDLSNCHNFSS